MEKRAIILSDFANGAQKTSSDLSKLAPVARVVKCAEHAFENVSNACMTAEKKFLTEQLCEKKGTSTLAKNDKPLVEVNRPTRSYTQHQSCFISPRHRHTT